MEKKPKDRAMPWQMMEHPWILEIKTKRVNMEHFLKTVWDWKD
jgi:mitogen-activated protein kinase kinase